MDLIGHRFQKMRQGLKIIRLLFIVLLFSNLSLAACRAQNSDPILRPNDLIEHPDQYLNRQVQIEIVEPLYGPATPAALAKTPYGQVRVLIPDGGGTNLTLVPKAFQLKDPNRYRHKFDRVISSPVRVKGEFLKDEELTKGTRRQAYVLRVASLENVTPGKAIPIPSLAVIKANPQRYDRKQIVYEGVYQTGFEVMALDKEIWLSMQPNATILGKSQVKSNRKQATANRVRVTGTLFAKPGARYGHLGGYPFEILIHQLEYLGPATSAP